MDKQLGQRIDHLDERERQLEAAIMSDPTEALSVSMMPGNLDSLKDQDAQQFTALRTDIGYTYDMSK